MKLDLARVDRHDFALRISNDGSAVGISRYQFEGGRIVSEYVVFDTGAVLTQLEREELPHGKR
jgi:hypothetical protein